MSYEIKDQYHMLVITMQTQITDGMGGTIELQVWKSTNHSSNPSKRYEAVSYKQVDNDWFYEFNVPNNDFNDGDVLDKFVIEYTGQGGATQLEGVALWDTNDGVAFMLDGEQVDEIHTEDTMLDTTYYKQYGYYKVKFENEGNHSVQAVYSGSRNTKMAYTTLERFIVKDTSSGGGGGSSAPIKGGYKLVVNNPQVLKNLVYGDKKKIYFKLTQNGQPVSRTIEIMNPKGSNYTANTNANGLAVLTNNGFNAGHYKIGAFFVQDGRIRAKEYKDIVIKKNEANLTFSHKALYNSKNVYQKKHRVYCKLTNHLGNPIKNVRLSIYHNNQLKQIKTNDKGYVSLDVGVGRHTFKAVYNGSKNYNKLTKKSSLLVKKTV